ncbi:BREX-1 system adenine-specific DNA-methyltransferase PglX [Raoultella planticola]|uniref:BREX-1 system adenine-specific DNA-methyltransferase PglX n=1 Tax=Raoultella planticola TaxID=575 RepID=UPI0027FDA97F|nr:BREX-1 system adenine-specific DNA-methyltransferase PglX [Raoultella ornithinolytica]
MSQQENNNMDKHFYRASAADFMKIPGSPIGYWVCDSIRNLFTNPKELVGNVANPNQALVTGNTDNYIRKWFEPSLKAIGFGLTRDDAKSSGKKWFPYNKGGDYRNWYGNFEHVVNWENDGYELQTTLHPSGNRVWAHNFILDSIFNEALVWSKIASGKPCFRYSPSGFLFDDASGVCSFQPGKKELLLGIFCSKVNLYIQKIINPTLNIQPANLRAIPLPPKEVVGIHRVVSNLINTTKKDWDSYEISWDFARLHLLNTDHLCPTLNVTYKKLRTSWRNITQATQHLEEENNRILIDAYSLQDELTPEVPINEITLTCNPYYRYGSTKTDEELEAILQSDTIAELISYAIGCMMGRYSLDREGLAYAHAGNEDFKMLVEEGAYTRFPADGDGILPLTSQAWFEDDITARVEEFAHTVWGAEHLEENLQFIADSLCLAAIKPVKKGGETARETIRRYLSTQFFKDHLKTYKKRPIYWLFSSGKEKAFECLVYLHRYNETTLPRMRTEYVTPLLGQMDSRIERLRLQQNEAETAEAKLIGKEIDSLTKQLTELRSFDDQLKHYADMKIQLDLDDGVKINYGKFGTLLAEVKAITGDKAE